MIVRKEGENVRLYSRNPASIAAQRERSENWNARW
jgi:hypothetical protein